MNNPNGWWISIFQKKSPKYPHSAMCSILMNGWKMTLTWHYGCNHRGVTL
jgi:hypothetical protein